ncbi:hypothetical protein KAT24_00060 [Candidatus Pacearchaeota archaeon]|nr:hypothetical protein [Candidatus Pacearchaeota archaeon]
MENYNRTQLEELLKPAQVEPPIENDDLTKLVNQKSINDNSEKEDIRMKIFRYTANFGYEYGQIAEDIIDFFKKTDGNVSYPQIYRKLRKFLEVSDEEQNFFGFFYNPLIEYFESHRETDPILNTFKSSYATQKDIFVNTLDELKGISGNLKDCLDMGNTKKELCQKIFGLINEHYSTVCCFFTEMVDTSSDAYGKAVKIIMEYYKGRSLEGIPKQLQIEY